MDLLKPFAILLPCKIRKEFLNGRKQLRKQT